MDILERVSTALLNFFFLHELLALALILVVEEAGVLMPPPGYSLIALAGARPGRTIPSDIAAIFVASAAIFAGSMLLFWLTRGFGRGWILRHARYFGLKQHRIDRMERWIAKYGAGAIVVGRMTPVLRVPTIVVAGVAGVPYRTFLLADAAAALIWTVVWFYTGAALQTQWALILATASRLTGSAWFPWVIVGLCALALGWAGWWVYQHPTEAIVYIRRLRALPRALREWARAYAAAVAHGEPLPQGMPVAPAAEAYPVLPGRHTLDQPGGAAIVREDE